LLAVYVGGERFFVPILSAKFAIGQPTPQLTTTRWAINKLL
jgi:hypothetical protein